MRTPEEVVGDYFTALSSSDLERTVGLFADDAAVMADGFETAIGPDELRAVYEGVFARARIEEHPQFDRTLQADDLAVVRTHSSGTITQLESGTATDVSPRELFVLRRSGDGWLIVEYIFNSGPADAT